MKRWQIWCSCNLRILVWEFAALQFYDAAKVASIGLDLVGSPHIGGGVGGMSFILQLLCSMLVMA